MIKKIMLSLIISSVLLLTSQSTYAEYNGLNNTNYSNEKAIIQKLIDQDDKYSVQDCEGNDLTSEFLIWYNQSQDKAMNEIFDYFISNDLSIVKTEEILTMNRAIGEAKTVTNTYYEFGQIYLDIPQEDVYFTFETVLRGSITYNVNTYDVLTHYGESITMQNISYFPMNSWIFGDSFTTSGTIDYSKSFATVSGSYNVKLTYGAGSAQPITYNVKTIRHSFQIQP